MLSRIEVDRRWLVLLAAWLLSAASPTWACDCIFLLEDDQAAIHLSDQSNGHSSPLLIDKTDLKAVPDPDPGPLSRATVAAIVQAAALANALDPRLVHAVIATESGYALRAVSPRGAQGLMQLMPATARHYGVADPFNATQNVRAGTTHLRSLLDRFGQNTALALAAYNAGAGAVERHGHRVPPFAETTAYVQRVLRRYEALRNRATHTTLARTS